jgi:ABC-type branched-subunit amino acid transport system substrate-binding protein
MDWLRGMKQGLIGVAVAIGISGPGVAADPGLTDNEIVIGLFGPLSGPLVGFGLDPVNAAKMWYDDINKKGGIHGRKIRLVIEDDKCTANDLVAVVKKLVTVDNVFMLHGGSCTAALTAAQEYINREKVPYAMLNAAGECRHPAAALHVRRVSRHATSLRRGARRLCDPAIEGQARRRHRSRR